jgi:hypothetical protein
MAAFKCHITDPNQLPAWDDVDFRGRTAPYNPRTNLEINVQGLPVYRFEIDPLPDDGIEEAIEDAKAWNRLARKLELPIHFGIHDE